MKANSRIITIIASPSLLPSHIIIIKSLKFVEFIEFIEFVAFIELE